MSTILNTDRKNNQKGMRTSFLVHALLLLLAFFIGCPYDPDKALETQYAVVVEFEKPEFVEFTNTSSSNSNKAESSSGAAKPKTDPVTEIKTKETKHVEVKRPEVKVKLPKPTPPKPTEPIISETTSEEETDIQAVEDEIQVDEPELDPLPEPEPDPVPDPEPPSNDKPVISILKDILTGKSKTKSSPNDNPGKNPSQTDGDGSGKGNTGSGKGNNTGGDDGDSGIGTGGSGTGEYDSSGDGVFGRKVIYRNYKEVLAVEFGNQAGKRITAKFCVNKQGTVTYAELVDEETNAIIPNGREGRKQVLKGIYGYKVEADLGAPAEQCGKLTIVLSEINALIGG